MVARQKCLVAAAIAGAALLGPGFAIANNGRAGDPRDVRGALDIASVSQSHSGAKLVHTVRFHQAFPSKLLRGGSVVTFAFDSNVDGRLDYLAIVFWFEGALRGALADAHGTTIVRVPASRPDARTIKVTLPTSAFRDPPTYRWTAFTAFKDTQACRKTCVDVAPNRGLMTHRVYVAPTLSVAIVGEGRVTALGVRPAIDCPAKCKATFHRGERVLLRAAVGPKRLFTGWSGACTGTDECVVKMDGDASVTANFVPLYDLTVAVTGNGYVVMDPPDLPCPPGQLCTQRYRAGTVVTLTARVSAAPRFDGWSGACSGIAPVCTITMDGDKAAFAAFGSDPPLAPTLSIALDAAPGASGRVTSDPAGIDCPSDCSETYTTNTIVTLTAVPAPGSVFLGWSGPCLALPSLTTCLVGMGPGYGADVTADATFGPSQ
jgi:hypothetical protein